MLVPTRPAAIDRRTDVGPRRIVVVGSTGSIGCSTLNVVRRNPERFKIVGLVANKQAGMLAAQVAEFRPDVAVLVQGSVADCALMTGAFSTVSAYSGQQAAIDLVSRADIDCVVAAAVGVAGVRTTLAALDAGKTVALANKESLVSAMALVQTSLAAHGGQLIPVDSEHSAIFQALQGEHRSDLARIILTASGGPFLDLPADQFSAITPAAAVRHPRWDMGAKISVDSATLFNKALELIEASYLFGLPEEQISVLVHPQSIIHSLIELRDMTMLAQLSVPDMVGAIGYALSYPQSRVVGGMKRLDLAALKSLDFRELDNSKFPSVNLARQALRNGGNAPAVLSIANEVAVERFMGGTLKFSKIPGFVATALSQHTGPPAQSIEELEALQVELRR